MSKLLNINNFAKAGLNSDLLPWDLPGDFLTDMSNIRIKGGKLSPLGGYSNWETLPAGFYPGYIMYAPSIGQGIWIIAGRDAVYAYDGSNLADISSAGGYSISAPSEDLWCGCLVASIPVITSPVHYPEYLPPATYATGFLPLPWSETQTWAEAGEACSIIRSHKQYLFALGIVTNGAEIPDGVRWSSPADIGGVPATWDPLDTTNVAGITTLGGEGGKIVDGLALRDSFVVYRESGISVFDYVGGQFVWQIRHLSTTVGLISTDSIVEIKGRHYFIGDGDILVNDGNSITSLLHNRIRERFTSEFNPDTFRRSYAVKNNVSSEIWFCIPTNDSEYPNTAYIYNWEDDTWSVRDILASVSANYGARKSAPITWDTIGTNWDETSQAWGKVQSSPMDDTVISVTKPADDLSSGSLLLLDYLSDIGYNSSIERVGLALDGLNNVTTMTRVYPRFNGPGNVFIELGSQDYPGSPVRWKQGVEFDASKDRKVDMRTTGELHCFRISSLDSNVHWELSGIDVEYVNAGAR